MKKNLLAYMPGEDTASQMFIKHHVACAGIISQDDDRSTASASQSACHAPPGNAHMAVAATPPSNLDHVHMPYAQTDAAEHGSIAQDTRVVVMNTQQLPMDMQGESCSPLCSAAADIVDAQSGHDKYHTIWYTGSSSACMDTLRSHDASGDGAFSAGATLYPFPRLLDKMPPCFHLLENFIDDGFENVLISVCDDVCVWNQHTGRGQQSYGRIFDFSTLQLSTSPLGLINSLPKALYDLWQWLLCHLPSINLASLLIVFYPPGRGIRWHTDLYPQNGREGYGKHVVGVSLLSDTVLWFRNRDGHEVSVFVPRRSMYLFYGPLRYEWQHSIRNCAPEESMGPRYALTFRDD